MDKKRFPLLQILVLLALFLGLANYSQGWTEHPEFVLLPLTLPLILCIAFSLCIYKFRYSLLGTKMRCPPEESESSHTGFTSLRGGWALWKAGTAGFVKLYDEGFFVRALLAGSGFLRFDEIQKVEKRYGTYRLTHSSPALRSPIDMSLNKQILAKLEVEQVDVTPMASKTKKLMILLVMLQLLALPFMFHYMLLNWEFGGFSEDKEHALLVRRGLLETIYDLNLESGEWTTLERNLGIGTRRSLLQYRDPEILRMIRTENRVREIRLQGKTLTEGWNGVLSPDGRLLAYSTRESKFRLRDVTAADKPLASVPATPADIRWTLDGKYLLLGLHSKGLKVKVFNSTGEEQDSRYAKWACLGPEKGQYSVLTRGDEPKIEVLSLVDSSLQESLSAPGVSKFEWHPLGSKILLQKKDGLYLAKSDLSEAKRVLETLEPLDFRWSTEGKYFQVSQWRRFLSFYNEQGGLVKKLSRR